MFGARVARLEDPIAYRAGGYTLTICICPECWKRHSSAASQPRQDKRYKYRMRLNTKAFAKFTLRLTCRIICVILLYLFKCQILRYRNHSNSVYLRIERSVLQGNPSPLLLPIQGTTPKMPQPWFKLTMIFYPGQLIVSPLSRTVPLCHVDSPNNEGAKYKVGYGDVASAFANAHLTHSEEFWIHRVADLR